MAEKRDTPLTRTASWTRGREKSACRDQTTLVSTWCVVGRVSSIHSGVRAPVQARVECAHVLSISHLLSMRRVFTLAARWMSKRTRVRHEPPAKAIGTAVPPTVTPFAEIVLWRCNKQV